MFKKLQQLQAIITYKNSENLGDIAILKSDLFGAKVSPTVASKLQPVVAYHREHLPPPWVLFCLYSQARLYPILAPQQIKGIFANLAKRRELGKKADFLLGYALKIIEKKQLRM